MCSSLIEAKKAQLAGMPPEQVPSSKKATSQRSWLSQKTSNFVNDFFRKFNNCFANIMHVLKGGNEFYKRNWKNCCHGVRSAVDTIAPISFIRLLKL